MFAETAVKTPLKSPAAAAGMHEPSWRRSSTVRNSATQHPKQTIDSEEPCSFVKNTIEQGKNSDDLPYKKN